MPPSPGVGNTWLANVPGLCHTYCMTKRINARLDPGLARKVDALRKRTGQSTTDILKASLESYYIAVTRDERPAASLADFVGCGTGAPSLSENYKDELTRSLEDKKKRKAKR